MRRGSTVALAAAVVLGAGTFTAAQGTGAASNVVEVRVQGNKQLSANAVLIHVKTRPGQPFSEDVVKADERRLLETGRFDSVVATRTQTDKGVLVVFTVVERPLVARLIFQGNKAIKRSELVKELTFGEGGPLSAFSVESGRQALLNKYKSSGYHFASVTVDKAALDAQRAVIYRIVEGPKVRVRKIRFEGNEYFGNFKLKQSIGTSARFWPLVDGYLDTEQIAQDVLKIRNLYLADGYLDAEVGRLMKFSEDRKDVTVTFLIKEGQRYRVNEVVFKGNSVFASQELAGRVKLGQGEFFTQLALQRDLKKVRDTYGELGYIEASVQSSRQFLDPTAEPPKWATHLGKPALLNVIFEIKESDQFRVGRVDIRGNTVTQGRVIRRTLRIFPEQLFNAVALEESRKRLVESRLFEEVSITPTGRAPGARDVTVQVTEGRTAQFLIGAGISTNSGLLGTVSFTQRNFDILKWPTGWKQFIKAQAFKGAGQTLRIVAEPGTELMRFHIEWFEPALFDRPYSLGTQVFLFNRMRESYDETRYGGVVSFGHRFKNRWYGELATRAEGVRIDDLDDDAPPEVIEDEGSHFLTGFKGSLIRDRTDSRWMPSAGDRIELSAEQVVGSHEFVRANGQYRIYRTVYVDAMDRKHILAGRAAVGHIFGGAPVFERFYGGGIGSVRGFKYRGISPRSKGTDEQIGGEFMIFAGAEYSFPIIGTEGQQLRGVVFLDSGTVEEDFGIETYRVSAGVGVRWVIPLFGPVPMAFDFGFPISKDDDDDDQIFSFSVGWSF
jgi:outer membrane protein insertion porin family